MSESRKRRRKRSERSREMKPDGGERPKDRRESISMISKLKDSESGRSTMNFTLVCNLNKKCQVNTAIGVTN